MKAYFSQKSSINSYVHRALLTGAALIAFTFSLLQARAQVEPTLLWTTNIGARLFALDSQTNLYANGGGTVIVLNRSGIPISTNQICPGGGLAQRDSAGNYYFSGPFTPPLDFGGLTLTSGNAFLAKYTPVGALIWAVPLSGSGRSITVNDLRLDPNGASYVGYWIAFSSFIHSGPIVSRFDANGAMSWVNNAESHNDGNPNDINLSSMTANGGAALFGDNAAVNTTTLSLFDAAGNRTIVTNWIGGIGYTRPVFSSSGNIFTIEYLFPNYTIVLTKRTAAGSLVWTQPLNYPSAYTTAPDPTGGVYVSTSPGALSDFDSNGNLIWTLPMPGVCREVIPDGNGNLFVWLNTGAIGRVALLPSTILSVSHASLGPNGFNLALNGGTLGTIWHVQGSSNLLNWVDLGTVTNNPGSAQFTDPAATNLAFRYYRVLH